MNGYIEVPNRGRRFLYTFEDEVLTVYSTNSLPLDTPTDLGVLSSNNYLIASVTGKSSLVIFFVDQFPFGDSGDGAHHDARFEKSVPAFYQYANEN